MLKGLNNCYCCGEHYYSKGTIPTNLCRARTVFYTILKNKAFVVPGRGSVLMTCGSTTRARGIFQKRKLRGLSRLSAKTHQSTPFLPIFPSFVLCLQGITSRVRSSPSIGSPVVTPGCPALPPSRMKSDSPRATDAQACGPHSTCVCVSDYSGGGCGFISPAMALDEAGGREVIKMLSEQDVPILGDAEEDAAAESLVRCRSGSYCL